MLKALIRKQFMELFKSYFVDRKTGKPIPRSKTVVKFVIFGGVLLLLCGVSFGLCMTLAEPLLGMGLNWLYYSLVGFLSIALGVFGSVFNTYAGLYLGKDNDLLIAMPIPPRVILLSRLTGVVGLSFLYSGCVWLPACVCSWIHQKPTAVSVVFSLLLTIGITLFVTVLTCFLGWVVALISKRLKNKSMITTIIALVFFIAYYFVCFRMESLVNAVIANITAVGEAVRKWLNMVYQLGHAALGETVPLLIFFGVTLALCALCYWIMSATFIRLATGSTARVKTIRRTALKPRSPKAALFRRELSRFTASSTYMLNAGFGIFIMPVLGVFALIKQSSLRPFIIMIRSASPAVGALIPLAIPCILCMILSINGISTPSVSLEGNRLWILKSLPVAASDVLRAKIRLHVVLNFVSAAVSAVLLCIALRVDAGTSLPILLVTGLFTWLTGILGLMLGLVRPNFHWTSEQTVIKQSMNVLYVMLIGLGIVILMAGGGFLLRNILSLPLWLSIFSLLEAGVSILLTRWIQTRGAKRFEEL